MFHKRTLALSGSCGLLLVLSILQATATSPPQSEKSGPADVSAGAERLPIQFLKRTFETTPGYTEQARLAGVEGTVIVYAEITKDGRPENLRILRSLGFGLDAEAIRAVQQWWFEPDPENESPGRVAMYVPVRFRLDRQMYGARLTGAAVENDIFQIAEGGITVPRIISRVEPSYTEEARTAKVEGTVVLLAEISRAGSVESVVALHKLGKGMDESAVRAIKQWKFSPALKDGRPVAVMITIEMNFSLGSTRPRNEPL
jgi:TonB family protein